VDTLDNIERLEAPISREALRPYLDHGRPVIVRGVLAGRLDPLPDLASVVQRFGAGVGSLGSERVTVADYFARDTVKPGSLGLTYRQEVLDDLVGAVRGSVIGAPDTHVVPWTGKRGCMQRFHCDMDASHNFLYQLFGSKRVCLVPPAQTQKIQPSLDLGMLLGDVPFEFLDSDEQLRFLRYADGRDTMLGPGEALYIPPLWWHFVRYETDSFALSWRNHGPAVAGLESTWQQLWPSEWPLWQGIVSRIATDPNAAKTHGARMRELAGRLDRPTTAVELHELHAELCPGRYARPFGAGDVPFFEPREQRPVPRNYDAWTIHDVPRVQAYVRFAPASEGDAAAILVIDGSRVAAEIELEPDEQRATLELLSQIDGRSTIAELAARTGWEPELACSVIDQLGSEGWVGVAKRGR
jgi:hypothetical protein